MTAGFINFTEDLLFDVHEILSPPARLAWINPVIPAPQLSCSPWVYSTLRLRTQSNCNRESPPPVTSWGGGGGLPKRSVLHSCLPPATSCLPAQQQYRRQPYG